MVRSDASTPPEPAPLPPDRVAVFVPRPEGGRTSIAPRSGIVGRPAAEGRVDTYYEGALHGPERLATFADRVHLAWGRLVTRAPTIARAHLPESTLLQVGEFDPVDGRVEVSEAGRSALAAWLGVDDVAPEELLTTNGDGCRRRELRPHLARLDALEPEARAWVEREARKLGLR